MTLQKARLAFFDPLTDPTSQAAMGADSHIELVALNLFDDVERTWEGLESANGYQVLVRTDAAKRPDVSAQWFVDAPLLERCPKLLAVSSSGAGFDQIDVAACTQAGVVACNNAGPGREAVAEHAVGMMLGLAKRFVQSDRALRSGNFSDRSVFRGTELLDKTIGLVGLGQIGQRIAEIAIGGFGMRCIACDPFADPDAIPFECELVDLPSLLERSDFVVAICALTDETRDLFDAAAFEAMKPSAYFVNCARGPIHNEEALVDALRSGSIAGAGIDVFHEEPPPQKHPLFELENVIVSPHSAGITLESMRNIGAAMADQWIKIFSGLAPPRPLNPEVWPRYCDRYEEIFELRPPSLENR